MEDKNEENYNFSINAEFIPANIAENFFDKHFLLARAANYQIGKKPDDDYLDSGKGENRDCSVRKIDEKMPHLHDDRYDKS